MRQDYIGDLDHIEHGLLPLAYSQAADGITVEADIDQGAGAHLAQIGIDAPLHDAEQRLACLTQRRERCLAALGPAERQLQRRPRFVMRRRKRRALVEHHLDVGAEQALHLDGALRRQLYRGAVDMRLEGDARFGNAAELGQRHDLIAAGIGEDRPVPMHEAMQAAEPGDALGARPQHQMIGVGEEDVGARRLHVFGEHGFDRGASADRHEGGRAHHPAWRGDGPGPRRAITRLHLK